MRNLQSHSFAKKQKIKRWVMVVAVFAIFVSFLYIFSFIMHAKFINISTVTVFGADQEISDSIKTLVSNDLQGNYLWFFPKTNTIFYPKNKIINDIKNNFPRVLNVNTNRDGLNGLRITIIQKTPTAIVCIMLPNFENNVLLVTDGDPCYLADKNGYLFEKSATFSDNPYNIYYDPNLNPVGSSTDFIGQFATSTDEYNLLQSFYDQTKKSAGISVDGILVKTGGEYEMYASSTIIYFNDREGLALERDNLILFWKHMIEDSQTNKKIPIFDYIDLRYGANVFYNQIK